MARAQLILDRYKPLGKAGSGGFATVQVAWDTRIQRKVAIKCIDLGTPPMPALDASQTVSLGGLDPDETAILAPAAAAPAAAAGAAGGRRVDGKAPLDAAATQALQLGDGFAPGGQDAAATQVLGGQDVAATQVLDGQDAAATRMLGDQDAAATQMLRGQDAARTQALGGAGAVRGTDPAKRNDYLQALRAFAHVPGLDEARTAAMLSDFNIVAVYDFEVQNNFAYIIMEYVDGVTLTELLRDSGDAMTLDAVAAVFSSVAHALEVAHDNQVLHLDIKPDNILIDRKGQVKVTDFGLARLATSAGYGSAAGGTVGYMPLEQMRGESLDARCDEWALAAVTYEMLTGENPFMADSVEQAERAIQNAELVLPSLCWDDLDDQVDDVLFYALDPVRDERYETVADFAEEMEKFLGSARAGRRELAQLVNGAGEEECGEADEPADETSVWAPRRPLSEIASPRVRAVCARVLAAAGSAGLAALGLLNLPGFSSASAAATSPVFWVPVAVAAALGALLPGAGVLAGYAVVAAALVSQGAWLPGIVLAAAAAAWWWYVGRFGAAQANCALAVPVAGAVGANALAPLAAGAVLRPMQALAQTAFSAVAALVLASLGTGNLLGWDAAATWNFAGRDVQAAFIGLLARPETWCMAGGWIAASGLLALIARKRSRAMMVVGVVVAAAVLVAVACGTAWLASGGRTFTPAVGVWLPIAGCAAAVAAMAAVFGRRPGTAAETAEAEEADSEVGYSDI